MYNDDVMRAAEDMEDMWAILDEQFEFVEHVLYRPVESREDALAQRYRPSGSKGSRLVISHRDAHPETSQRDHFLKMGRNLAPRVAHLLNERKFTPQFVQAWGMVMYCHGYIAAHIFDSSDDMQAVRAGSRPKRDAQRQWVAATLLEFIDTGLTRGQAEERTAEKARSIIKSGKFPMGFDVYSFKAILPNGHDLATTYSSKKLTITQMRKLLSDRAE